MSKKPLTPAEINAIAGEIKTKYSTDDVSHVQTLENSDNEQEFKGRSVRLKIYRHNQNRRKKSIFFAVI